MKKTLVVLIVGLLCFLMCGAFAFEVSGSQSSVDWPMFHQNLTHTGYSTSTVPDTNSTSWTYTTGSSVYSSPAVANGTLYVGSDDGNIYALNATTGSSIWTYPTYGSVQSSPTVANGMIIVGSDDYNVYALSLTGGSVWNYTTNGAVESSPTIANGTVYVGSVDGNLYALNESTGDEIWAITVHGAFDSCPAVFDGIVYAGSVNGSIYALEASSGALIWNSRISFVTLTLLCCWRQRWIPIAHVPHLPRD